MVARWQSTSPRVIPTVLTSMHTTRKWGPRKSVKGTEPTSADPTSADPTSADPTSRDGAQDRGDEEDGDATIAMDPISVPASTDDVTEEVAVVEDAVADTDEATGGARMPRPVPAALDADSRTDSND